MANYDEMVIAGIERACEKYPDKTALIYLGHHRFGNSPLYIQHFEYQPARFIGQHCNIAQFFHQPRLHILYKHICCIYGHNLSFAGRDIHQTCHRTCSLHNYYNNNAGNRKNGVFPGGGGNRRMLNKEH